MTKSIDIQMVEAGVRYRDRAKDPDPRVSFPQHAVEIDKGFQAPFVLGEGDSPARAFEAAKRTWEKAPEPREPSYEELATTAQTWRHIDLVRKLLRIAAVELLTRGETHDRSKLDRAEVDVFTEYTPKLKGCTYGSDEYKTYLKEMKPALDHHYAHNRHHPEFFAKGLKGMDLVDLLEMFCDWMASTKRHDDGNIMKSIEINQGRFGYDDVLADIFRNTVKLLESE